MTFKRILKKSGMNIEEFSEYFKIPYETVCSWNDGTQPCPEYLMELMNYKIITEERKKDLELLYYSAILYQQEAEADLMMDCEGYDRKELRKIEAEHDKKIRKFNDLLYK